MEGLPHEQLICGTDVLGPGTATGCCAIRGACDDDGYRCAGVGIGSGITSGGGEEKVSQSPD